MTRTHFAPLLVVVALLAAFVAPGCESESWESFALIVSKGDNIPILMMIPLFGFFTWLAFNQGRKNDRLIKKGKRDDVLRRMQD